MDLTEKTLKTLADFAEFRKRHEAVKKQAQALISEKLQTICEELDDVRQLATCAAVKVDMSRVGETFQYVRECADVWFDGGDGE